MQGIEFDDEKDLGIVSSTNFEVVEKEPSFTMKLLEKAGITDAAIANLILLGVAAIFFGLAIVVYAGLFKQPTKDWSLDARAILEAERHQYPNQYPY